jgi:hypothetical protein
MLMIRMNWFCSMKFCLIFVLTTVMSAISMAQNCPHQLLFSFGELYYYNLKNCTTQQIVNELACYRAPVATGCAAGGACNTNEAPFSLVFQPQVVGDPPGQVAQVIKKLPPDSTIMTPFGQNIVGVVGGYPKFVTGKINNVDRFFKIYYVSYQDPAGVRREVRIGHEVTGIPANTQSVNATAVEIIGKRARLSITENNNPVFFEAFYATDEQQPAGN